jgi:heme/copper-type cytochrome/quinol oxidase subunit 3
MNIILYELFRPLRQAWYGIGAGLIMLGCAGLTIAALFISHASHWPLVSTLLLASGCVMLSMTHGSSNRRIGNLYVVIAIAVVLSAVFITGDVRSWIPVTLVAATAIVVSLRRT